MCFQPCLQPQEYKDNPQLAEEAWRLMVAASGKLTLLQQLLPRLLSEGHRVLVFSQSVEVHQQLPPCCWLACAATPWCQ